MIVDDRRVIVWIPTFHSAQDFDNLSRTPDGFSQLQ